MTLYDCPKCSTELEKVVNPSDSPWNDEQFDSMKLGDYFCRQCPDENTKSGFTYYRTRDLDKIKKLKDRRYV